jgi:hypothetical protein
VRSYAFAGDVNCEMSAIVSLQLPGPGSIALRSPIVQIQQIEGILTVNKLAAFVLHFGRFVVRRRVGLGKSFTWASSRSRSWFSPADVWNIATAFLA